MSDKTRNADGDFVTTESYDAGHIDMAMDGIWRAFVWYETPEGHDYWAEVARKLTHMRTQAEDASE